MNDEAEITVSMVDSVRIVRVGGELDPGEADTLIQGLAVPPDGSPLATVVDLSGVTFADSSFLHMLLTARQDHDRAGLPLVLADVSPFVQRLLDLTDTARAFTIAPGLPAAVELARGPHDASPHHP
ncbi:STAS domain-containing protein [Streptomyces cinereospinus]|uniref:STAS domain-containing protein n=1 Tax=Streptomyces cinereospinus TaxID=285561 RepID=A0ABV5N0R0_9ACTN